MLACTKDRPNQTSTDVAPTGDGTNYGPVALQSCEDEGATKECGRVYHTDGDYVYCSVGHTTCTDGAWGECEGDHFVVKSDPSLRLESQGLRFQALGNAACSNACDPYCLQLEQQDPGTVSAPGIVSADAGGVTLEWKEIQLTDNTNCTGLQCALVICGSSATTTITGRVFDPAGKNPLYNAEVYIPLHPNDALPAFGTGASCDTCGGAQALDAIRATQTDANGNFTLSDVPAGSNIPIVVQMGKWRREIVLKTIQSCTNNVVANNCTTANPKDCVFRLPRNQRDGFDPVLGTYTKADLPQTAIITGSADPFDCLLLKAGIDPTEVGDSSSNKRIHFYQSDSSPGNTLNAAYGNQIQGSALWNDLKGTPPNMMSYDVILLPCEGGAYDKQKTIGTNTPYKNLLDYTNSGGRAFATHYTYSWLAFTPQYVLPPDNWSGVATWTQAKVTYSPTKFIWTGSSINTQDPQTGIVNTSFPKGAVLSQWLTNVKATTKPRRLKIHEGRQDLSAIGSGAQSWMTAKDLGYAGSPTYTNLFTFNTPYGAEASKQCGRMVYSDFHVSAAARTQCPGGVCQDACLSDTDCGFTATCEGETAGAVGQCNEPCASNEDCPNSTYSCNGVNSGECKQTTCTKDTECGTGRTCQSTGCTCIDNGDCNGGNCGNKLCDAGTTCHADINCGKGTCGRGTGAKAGTCKQGFACRNDSQCGPTGTCGSGTSSTKGVCSRTTGYVCHKGSECDSGSCGTGTGAALGTCSYGATTICHKGSECDSGSCGTGTGATAGTCSYGASTVCHRGSECDSGSCGTGAGSTAGSCSTGATICHAASECDSGLCGSGTGSTAGSCSSSGAICHANADCDSNACGSGTGSSKGVCSILGGIICHKNADCDSGTCGSGTLGIKGLCSVLGGASCHKNADCDSGSCGTGLNGSAAGKCATGLLSSCHKAADCDSNVCGSGTGGSLKGLCNGLGTCSSSAQCGGSATCIAGRCTALTPCSADSACGTGGICNGATCTAKTCAADTACGVSNMCNGATCTAPAACSADSQCLASQLCIGATCGSPLACSADSQCLASRTCIGARCSTQACTGDSTCTATNICNGAKCATKACAGDSACGVSNTCNGAKCSTPATCAGDAACPSSRLCNNAKCSTPTGCAGDAACPSSGLCNNAKCSTAAGCAGDVGCPSSGVCTGAKCSVSACAVDTDCPLLVCTGATCNASDCSTSADCASGAICGGSCGPATCTTGAECWSGSCVEGLCACAQREDCGGSQYCWNGVLGTCGRNCTTDDECAPDRCVAGKCGGCTSDSECHDAAYTATCAGIPPANYGSCSTASASVFPESCKQGDLLPQEKALEFMFFDLTACVSPDNLPPPKPITNSNFQPATFVQDFTAACPPETQPFWRDFDWQATVPTGTSIDFAAQTGDSLEFLGPDVPVYLGKATASTNVGPTKTKYDALLIDTGLTGTGAFNIANPVVLSKKVLRIMLTLNPNEDKTVAPRLQHWKVQYDCQQTN